MNRPNIPRRAPLVKERCFSHVQGSTAPPIEVWIKPFQRFAGSQGSALSRIPQDAESPFETRGSARVSTNSRFKRRPQAARLFCAQSALMKTNLRIGFQFCPCRLSPEQSGGLETLLRRRTKGSFKKGTENQRMDNLRFSSIAKRYATGISFTVRSKIAYRRSPRVRTPAAYFKAHSRPFATPFSLVIRVTVSRRQGGNVRTPHGGCVPSGAPCYAGATK